MVNNMDVLMPQIGMTMVEGTVDNWLVNDGDTVKQGDIIAEISTEKLTSEIEAPADGVIKILVEVDESAECGAVIARIS